MAAMLGLNFSLASRVPSPRSDAEDRGLKRGRSDTETSNLNSDSLYNNDERSVAAIEGPNAEVERPPAIQAVEATAGAASAALLH